MKTQQEWNEELVSNLENTRNALKDIFEALDLPFDYIQTVLNKEGVKRLELSQTTTAAVFNLIVDRVSELFNRHEELLSEYEKDELFSTYKKEVSPWKN